MKTYPVSTCITSINHPNRLLRKAFMLSLLGWLYFAGAAYGETTIQVSVDSDGNDGNGESTDASISGDGRYVAFTSSSDNLVDDDTNELRDIFVHDGETGETTRVSVNSHNVQANGVSSYSSISADGRYVAFVSTANNLVPRDTNQLTDVFVHDRLTGETSRVSVDSTGQEANGHSAYPAISADGCCVAFTSSASNLVSYDTNGFNDVFVHDRRTGETTRVSVDSEGNETNAASRVNASSISGDGRYVAFDSLASNLVPDDTNGSDIFVHDRETGNTIRVSVDSEGNQANGSSSGPSISANGRFVAFTSAATNLVPEDTSDNVNIFVHDLESGTTTQLNVSSDDIPSYDIETRASCGGASISGNGRYLAFGCYVEGLDPYAGYYRPLYTAVFHHDRMSLKITPVWIEGYYFHTHEGTISDNGSYVAFEAYEYNGLEVYVSGPYISEHVAVDIEIAPKRDPNRIKPDRGRPAVAVLTDELFDASQVDPSSVRFGPAEAEPMIDRIIDVDSDGDLDQVFYFLTEQTGIACGDTEATLTGETFEDVVFSGTDSIITVGCRNTLAD